MYKEIKQCRICGNKNLVPILDLGMQALTGTFPKSEIDEVDYAPIELVKCFDSDHTNNFCDLVQLKHTYTLSKLYGNNYGYRSGLNKSMVNHLKDIVLKIESFVDLCPGDLVVDIGSNDATLLKSYSSNELDLVGVDPSALKFIEFYPPTIKLLPTFFSYDSLHKIINDKKAKVITSIAMFYDLEDPVSFAVDIFKSLSDTGIWVLEQSYLPSMLTENAYDTVCHEHLEYYSLQQIQWICDKVGFKILDVEFNNTNGGSFKVTLAKRMAEFESRLNTLGIIAKEKIYSTISPYTEFLNRIEENKQNLVDLINFLNSKGKRIFGYGASTKGNVLLQYCNISDKQLIAIAEVNQDKYGCYTPGTKIPIISEKQAKEMNPDYFLVLPWHFKDTILYKEKELLEKGCKFIFPLPEVQIVSKDETIIYTTNSLEYKERF